MTVTGGRRRVTSEDVARAAGVSRATVSYVLNDNPHHTIPDTTRRSVLEAAARLGYMPSAAARTLSSGRSDVVLCLLPDWPIGPSVGEFLQVASAAFAAQGLTFVVHSRTPGGRPISEVWKAITPAAVVAVEEFDDQEAAAMRAAGIDVTVMLFTRLPHQRGEVTHPEALTGRIQAEHLAALGHRIGYAYPDDERLRILADPRLAGVREACERLGLPSPVVRTVPLDAEAAAAAVSDWLAVHPPVTGVCAYNDEVALAILAGLRVLGLKAPDDVAVVGVDDTPAAALAAPPLTTVTADTVAWAEQLVGSVVAALTGRPEPAAKGPCDVRLTRRQST